MAEQRLYSRKIGAAFHQMSGKAMATMPHAA
jgi:hypothetical protein